MSQGNAETVRQFFEAVAREDWVAMENLFDADCQVDDFDMPDASGYRGHKGVFDWITEWDDAWDSWDMSDLEFHPLAGERVIAFFTMTAIGRGSGIELNRRDAMLYALRGGKIQHLAYYNEQQRALALEAADLPEEDLEAAE
jgi:ketosteroid isomerase-like protein